MSLLTDILEHLELEPAQLTAYIDEYESIQPYDCMIDTARAVVAFFAQSYEESQKWILSALQKNPGNYMNHFYYALIAHALGQHATAVTEGWVANNFATQFGPPSNWEKLSRQLNAVMAESGPCLSQEESEKFRVQKNILQSPGSYFPAYYLSEQKKWSRYQGAFLYFDSKKTYNDYICIWACSYWDTVNGALQQALLRSDGYHVCAATPIESWKAIKTQRFELEKKNFALAVAATVPGQTITISPTVGKSVHFTAAAPNIYHYMTLDEAGVLSSSQDFIVSKPVAMDLIPKKKKLIFTIFVDAISQWYLSQSEYRYMPFTKAFFDKGTIFKNCYSTGEWTQPSVASLNTGLYTSHHHIIYRSSAYHYPQYIRTASEIFNEDGYFTALVSGSVGTSPYLGGLRGFDSAIYKSVDGFPDSHLISDALNYTEAFPNTNKYISLGLFGPHLVLDDSAGFSLNLSMPEQTALSFRDTFTKTNEGKEKSVWRHVAESDVRRYQIALSQCDRQLKGIYDYVTSHYSEDEYIFCLYSDHGVSMVSDEDYLLKPSQTNSVLMLRGGGVPVGISEEYINHIDYLPILTKLAGIDVDFSQYDCVLPRAFGGPGRDYVYTESIYAGQTYKAAVRTDEFECRFESNANTDIDGLIDLSQGYMHKVFSRQTGEEIQDQELSEDFEAIVFDHIKENIKY